MDISQRLILRIFILFITTLGKAQRIVDVNRRGCGETKGCLFKPAGCDPQLDCIIGIIFYVSGPNMLTVQLVAQGLHPVPQYQYIAMGFSEDDVMGDDYVIECVLSRGGNAFGDVEVFASFNHGKANDRTLLNTTERGILFSDVQGEVVDGCIMCQFTQQIIPQISNKSHVFWNLNRKFYIMGATGNAQPDKINVHDTTVGSHFFPITTARSVNPSLVGHKIYELPPPPAQDKRENTNSDENRTQLKQFEKNVEKKNEVTESPSSATERSISIITFALFTFITIVNQYFST